MKNAAGVEFWLNTHDHGEIEPENELEKTWRLKQDEVASLVEVGAASKRYDLKASWAPTRAVTLATAGGSSSAARRATLPCWTGRSTKWCARCRSGRR